MIADDPFVSDSRLSLIHSLSFRFAFKIQGGKLTIQVLCSDDNTQYYGQVSQNPQFTFNQIQQNMRAKEFRILIKNQDIFKIRIQQLQIELFSMSKLQLNQLKEATRTLNQRQEEFRLMIHAQIDGLNKMREDMKNLETNELKETTKKTAERQEQFRMIIQSQNEEVQDLKDGMKNFKLQIKNLIGEIKRINQESIKSEILKLTTQIKNIENQTKKNIQAVKKCNEKVGKNEKQVKKNSEYIKSILIDMEKVIGQSKNLGQYNIIQKKKLGDKIFEKVNFNSLKSQRQPPKIYYNNLFKWSQQLKSSAIRINGNVVTRTKNTYYEEFCLLNASFSNTLNTKQSWAIKIKDKTGGIWLGVCLKNKMQKYNFNGKNIKWNETGHGLYLINSFGWCYSHSQKEFNHVLNKSFKFDEDDVIFIEYDCVNNKLRLSKNKVDNFEMQIIAPPQNDAYHPCVGLGNKNQQVELIELI